MLECIVNGKSVTHLVHDVQYIPALTYALLSCKALNHHGLSILLGNGTCKILHSDGSVIAESLKNTEQLYFLNMVNTPTVSPHTDSASVASFNLLHKQLIHPGKDALQLMICKNLVVGVAGVPNDSKDFNCVACIHGKMM